MFTSTEIYQEWLPIYQMNPTDDAQYQEPQCLLFVVLDNQETYIIRSYGASRIARHKLDLHGDVSKQILVLGSKSRS